MHDIVFNYRADFAETGMSTSLCKKISHLNHLILKVYSGQKNELAKTILAV